MNLVLRAVTSPQESHCEIIWVKFLGNFLDRNIYIFKSAVYYSKMIFSFFPKLQILFYYLYF